MFFGLRTMLQWLKSEAAHKSVSPVSYWIFSVIGACLMFIYGVIRNDFSIILGQFISYYIYLWNLNANGIWTKIKSLTRVFLFILPLVATVFLLNDAHEYSESFFNNHDIPVWLVVFGSVGQVMFTLRFVYQFIFSHRRHVSVLPRGFWIISLAGSGIDHHLRNNPSGRGADHRPGVRLCHLHQKSDPGSGKTQSSDAE